LGDKKQALDFYQQALPILRDVGNRSVEATTLNNIGLVYRSLGDKQQALDHFEQALPISRDVGDRDGEATMLFNMSLLAENTAEAIQLVEQARDLWRAVQSPNVQIAEERLRELRGEG
jgi:tetratricopeptide (TPR) repeat protein